MKKLIMIIVMLYVCSAVAFADTYCGEYSGNDVGVWTMYHDPNGVEASITVVWSTLYNIMDFGTVEITNGAVVATLNSGAVFTGTVDETSGDVTGTWLNGVNGGTMEGDKIEIADISDYSGTFSIQAANGMTFTGTVDGVGLISVQKTTSGTSINGKGIVDIDGNIFCKFSTDGLYGTTLSGYYYETLTATGITYAKTTATGGGTTGGGTTTNKDDDDSSGCFIGMMPIH